MTGLSREIVPARRVTMTCATLVTSLLLVSVPMAQTTARPAQPAASRSVLYAAAGATLTRYEIDPDRASLTRRESITLPAAVQYAWPHPSHKYFYVVWSNGGAAAFPPGTTVVPRGTIHGVGAFQVGPDGVLSPRGTPLALATRPIHASVDAAGTHLLIAYNDPSSLTVYRLNADGTIGTLVNQPGQLDTGIYAHQIRTERAGRTLFLVTRGNGPTKDKPEDRGALKVFRYTDGVLSDGTSIAPNGGVNFQPRHLDFHPSRPWVFVSLERQSKLQVYGFENGRLTPNPLFTKDTLADPARRTLRQNAGTVHVHPNGRFLYQANRSAVPGERAGTVTGGGENSIVVWAIDSNTGEPSRIQNADTHGAEPRTFALDPTSRLLVAGNQVAMRTGTSAAATTIPASLAVFRVLDNGTLTYVRTYPVDTSAGGLFWMGIAELP